MSDNRERGEGGIIGDVEAERSVIRQCLEGPATGAFPRSEALLLALSSLTASDFVDDANRRIFGAIQRAAKDTAAPVVTTPDVEHLLEGEYLKATLYEIIGAGMAEHSEAGYKRVLDSINASTLGRGLVDLARDVDRGARVDPRGTFNDLLERSYSMARSIHATTSQHISVYIPDAKEEIDRRSVRGGMLGFRCGIPAIDQGFEGIQKEMLHVLGARPKMGKSLVAGQIAQSLSDPAFDGEAVRTLIFSPEMSAVQYMNRLATVRANVDWAKFKKGRLSPDEMDRIKDALDYFEHCDLIIDPAGRQTVSSIRQAIIRWQPQVVIIDYLQLIEPDRPTDNEYRDLSEVSKAINAMKTDFNIAIIACAQLNRNVDAPDRKDKRPVMADLRGTGQIEQDADRIIFLYRDSRYYEPDGLNDRKEPVDPEAIDFICGKDRHGEEWWARQWIRDGRLWVVGRGDHE